MMDFLSDWLRNIIAVILLAVFVELLLPNKAMQRYARLVVGLFVLLTLMTPIFQLLQGDFEQKLETSFQNWSAESGQQDLKMPTLSEIRKEADELSSKRAADVEQLSKKVLEQDISRQVKESTGAETMDVQIIWKEQTENNPEVRSVVITLKPAQSDADSPAGSRQGSEGPVQPVQVDVNVEPVEAVTVNPSPDLPDGKEDGQAAEAWAPVSAVLDRQVRQLLQNVWGIAPELVIVRQPADAAGNY
ncbi:stage III sporulation protein AF [Paenibacillus protaetiae]|uniref:Stage III sporulation protein AF n=1 Tax=Paenibacillus protaetiae TaxID=2509456 RepID=A0A4V0YF27_9BACL|nr:stage III sporulation protein AF [Paenibacillus protaetiae]QAY66251.1 stage III sporulation protein AF [Paenibacillus protaetiae]